MGCARSRVPDVRGEATVDKLASTAGFRKDRCRVLYRVVIASRRMLLSAALHGRPAKRA